MKTLDERITEAEGALEQAKASGDSTEETKVSARLDALREAKDFHTKEFERVGKKIRSEGAEAKEKDIAEALGVPLEEAKTMIQEYRDIQEATETETERERKAKETAEQKAQSAEERANSLETARQQDLIRYELKDALRDAGIKAERIPLALKVADTSSVEIEEGAVKGLDSVVESVKNDSPEWFGNQHRSLPGSPSGGGDSSGASGGAKGYLDRKYARDQQAS